MNITQIKPNHKASEHRRLQFRCAAMGSLFFILFRRYSPSHKFQIVSISKDMNKPSSALLPPKNTPNLPFDASDFDWTGWFCPHCGHSKTFVQCGRCKEVICGDRVRHLQSGTMVFACHNGCGGTGVVKGHIESVKGSNERGRSREDY